MRNRRRKPSLILTAFGLVGLLLVANNVNPILRWFERATKPEVEKYINNALNRPVSTPQINEKAKSEIDKIENPKSPEGIKARLEIAKRERDPDEFVSALKDASDASMTTTIDELERDGWISWVKGEVGTGESAKR